MHNHTVLTCDIPGCEEYGLVNPDFTHSALVITWDCSRILRPEPRLGYWR
jgi:hypothetical protein